MALGGWEGGGHMPPSHFIMQLSIVSMLVIGNVICELPHGIKSM